MKKINLKSYLSCIVPNYRAVCPFCGKTIWRSYARGHMETCPEVERYIYALEMGYRLGWVDGRREILTGSLHLKRKSMDRIPEELKKPAVTYNQLLSYLIDLTMFKGLKTKYKITNVPKELVGVSKMTEAEKAEAMQLLDFYKYELQQTGREKWKRR